MKRKILSLVMIFALCMSIFVSVNAAEPYIISGNQFTRDYMSIDNFIEEYGGFHYDEDGEYRVLDTDFDSEESRINCLVIASAPATVTVLKDTGQFFGFGGQIAWAQGSRIFKIDADLSGYDSYIEWDQNYGEWEEVPLTAGERRTAYFDPEEGEYVDYETDYEMEYTSAGSTFVLKEGTYIVPSPWAALDLCIIVLKDDVSAPETPSSWAVEQVSAAIEAGLVPEALQSKYTQATTRAEFAALAVALYENIKGHEIAINRSVMFSDTTDINVYKAATIGVVTGVGSNRFDPDAPLTREQAAVMLYRLSADALDTPLAKGDPFFDDADSISPWAWNEVGVMQAAGIMGGVGNNMFAPKAPYTREQSIVTIMRLFNEIN